IVGFDQFIRDSEGGSAFFQKVPSCLVGMEACATSHHWSRELQALGHTVRLMPPADVKPYVKRQKNDATDAEAICEAVTRANMRFVATKTPEGTVVSARSTNGSYEVRNRPQSSRPPRSPSRLCLRGSLTFFAQVTVPDHCLAFRDLYFDSSKLTKLYTRSAA